MKHRIVKFTLLSLVIFTGVLLCSKNVKANTGITQLVNSASSSSAFSFFYNNSTSFNLVYQGLGQITNMSNISVLELLLQYSGTPVIFLHAQIVRCDNNPTTDLRTNCTNEVDYASDALPQFGWGAKNYYRFTWSTPVQIDATKYYFWRFKESSTDYSPVSVHVWGAGSNVYANGSFCVNTSGGNCTGASLGIYDSYFKIFDNFEGLTNSRILNQINPAPASIQSTSQVEINFTYYNAGDVASVSFDIIDISQNLQIPISVNYARVPNGTGNQSYDNFVGLTAGDVYHWRAKLIKTDGSEIDGTYQNFVINSNATSYNPIFAPTASMSAFQLSGASTFCDNQFSTSGTTFFDWKNLANGLCKVLGFLIIPSQGSVNSLATSLQSIQEKAPFSYYNAIKTDFTGLSISSTSMPTITFYVKFYNQSTTSIPLLTYQNLHRYITDSQYTIMYNIMTYGIWILFAMAMWYDITHLLRK